jgi:hypothetical protein
MLFLIKRTDGAVPYCPSNQSPRYLFFKQVVEVYPEASFGISVFVDISSEANIPAQIKLDGNML